MSTAHFRLAPWLLTKKTAKTGTLYVGISMVCMTLLKKKVDHGLAADNTFGSLLCFACPPKTLPLCYAPSLPTSTGGGRLGAGGKRALPIKKNHPPHHSHELLLEAQTIAPNNTNTTSIPRLSSLTTFDPVAVPMSPLPSSLCPV
jgi:hypothetical protein